MKTYEDMLEEMYSLFADALKECLPVPEKMRELWSNPERLDWIALGQEQESWYLNFACGEALSEQSSVRGYVMPLGECLRKGRQRGEELLDLIQYELIDWSSFETDEDGEAVEEQELDDDREEMKQFLIFSALGLVIHRVKKELLPTIGMEKAAEIELTVFDDVESSTFDAQAPSYSGYILNEEEFLKLIPRISTDYFHQEYLQKLIRGEYEGRNLTQIMLSQSSS